MLATAKPTLIARSPARRSGSGKRPLPGQESVDEWFRRQPVDWLEAAEIDALHGYLTGRLTERQAAEAYTAGVNRLAEQEQVAAVRVQELEDHLQRIWAGLVEAAGYLPKKNADLVRLLGAIKNMPEPQREGKPFLLRGRHQMWKELFALGWIVRGAWERMLSVACFTIGGTCFCPHTVPWLTLTRHCPRPCQPSPDGPDPNGTP